MPWTYSGLLEMSQLQYLCKSDIPPPTFKWCTLPPVRSEFTVWLLPQS